MVQILNRSILLLSFVAIVYNALAFGGVRLIDQAVSMLLITVALGLWVWRILITSRVPRVGVAGWCLLGFVGYVLVRHHYAEIEYVSRRELLDIGIAVALYFLVGNAIEVERDLRYLMLGLLIVSTLLAFYAGYQFMAQSDLVWASLRPASYHGRGSGTFINPNHLAGFLEMTLPLGVGCVALKRVSWAFRILAGYMVLCIVAGIGFTLSRGGWVAAAFGLACVGGWLCLARRQSRWWLAVILLSLIAGGVIISTSFVVRDRFEMTQQEFRYWKASSRVLIWKAAYAEWQENFWWGSGGDHFQYRYFAHRDEWLQSNPVRVHNDYLNTLSDYGLVGGAIVGCFVAALFWGGLRSLGRARAIDDRGKPGGSNRSIMLAGALSGLAALAVHSWFDFNLHIRSNLLLAALLGGVVLGTEQTTVARGPTGRAAVGLARLFKGVVAAMAVAASVAFVWQGRRAFLESHWLQRGKAPNESLASRAAAYRAALAIEPGNPASFMKLGELYQQRSLLGEDDYREMAELAIEQHKEAMRLLPASPWPLMNIGVCLDWLGRGSEAQEFFERMIAADPNGKRTRAMMGWHYFQVEDFAKSREWIQRARALPHDEDAVAASYDRALRERGH